MYADYGLMRYGFPAESVRNRSVCVVKTHEWGEEARRPFDRAVLLVRSPAAAILAEFNRQSAGHVGYASPDKYKGKKAQCKYFHLTRDQNLPHHPIRETEKKIRPWKPYLHAK